MARPLLLGLFFRIIIWYHCSNSLSQFKLSHTFMLIDKHKKIQGASSQLNLQF